MLILASKSNARQNLLQNAGLQFESLPSPLNEDGERNLIPLASAKELASHLALRKAQAVALQHPRATIIGADQTLALGGSTFRKPKDIHDAQAQLKTLRGKTHELHSAFAIVRGNQTLFEHVSTAQLTMRDFSDAFLEHYLKHASPDILACVGCYQIEAEGIQLFDHIEGDHTTILGLPMMPLLAFLRKIGEITS